MNSQFQCSRQAFKKTPSHSSDPPKLSDNPQFLEIYTKVAEKVSIEDKRTNPGGLSQKSRRFLQILQQEMLGRLAL